MLACDRPAPPQPTCVPLVTAHRKICVAHPESNLAASNGLERLLAGRSGHAFVQNFGLGDGLGS